MSQQTEKRKERYRPIGSSVWYGASDENSIRMFACANYEEAVQAATRMNHLLVAKRQLLAVATLLVESQVWVSQDLDERWMKLYRLAREAVSHHRD